MLSFAHYPMAQSDSIFHVRSSTRLSLTPLNRQWHTCTLLMSDLEKDTKRAIAFIG